MVDVHQVVCRRNIAPDPENIVPTSEEDACAHHGCLEICAWVAQFCCGPCVSACIEDIHHVVQTAVVVAADKQYFGPRCGRVNFLIVGGGGSTVPPMVAERHRSPGSQGPHSRATRFLSRRALALLQRRDHLSTCRRWKRRGHQKEECDDADPSSVQCWPPTDAASNEKGSLSRRSGPPDCALKGGFDAQTDAQGDGLGRTMRT
jgi:hypothetical protein